MALPEERAGRLLDEVSPSFHSATSKSASASSSVSEQVRESLPIGEEISERRRLLIGSYFLASTL